MRRSKEKVRAHTPEPLGEPHGASPALPRTGACDVQPPALHGFVGIPRMYRTGGRASELRAPPCSRLVVEKGKGQ